MSLDTRRSKRAARGRKLNTSINEIYAGERTRTVKFSRTSTQRKGTMIFAVILALGAFTALAWVGFYLFGDTIAFNDKHIEISIDTPRAVASGDAVNFTVHYKNQQDIELGDVEMRIKPPEGFILAAIEPKANGINEYHFKLGKLAPRERGKIIARGTFVGTKDGNNEITVYFSYRPENFNSTFEKIATSRLEVDRVPLALTISAPESVAAGEQTTFNVRVNNISPHDIGPIMLTWELPDQFEITTSTPDIVDHAIPIESITAGSEWLGTISGVFKNSAVGEHETSFYTHIVIDGNEYLQNDVAHIIDVTQAHLEANLSINDFEKKGSVAPGQELRIQATITNTGSTANEDVEITLDIEEPTREGNGIIIWDDIAKEKTHRLAATETAENRRRTSIVWNANNTPELLRIEPNTTATKTLTLPITTPKEFGGQLPGNTIIISMRASSSGRAPTHTAPFEVMLRSDTEVSARAQIAGDPIISVGPDGLTEVIVRPHTVTFTVTNSLHELEALEMVAALPPDVAFEKTLDVPAGEIQFNASQRTLRWILNKLPTSIREIPFSVRMHTITPMGDEESGTLVNEIEFTAIDAASGEPFKIKLGEVARP